MKRHLLVTALFVVLVSCDDGPATSPVSVGGEGFVSGPEEAGGRTSAAIDKSFYSALEFNDPNGGLATDGSRFGDEPWFVLSDGDRVRLLELDLDARIGRVEALSGFCAGRTGWISLDCVKR